MSIGNYLCKIDGKCYYCDTKTNPDMNKNCYKETTCDKTMTVQPRPSVPRVPVQPPVAR